MLKTGGAWIRSYIAELTNTYHENYFLIKYLITIRVYIFLPLFLFCIQVWEKHLDRTIHPVHSSNMT